MGGRGGRDLRLSEAEAAIAATFSLSGRSRFMDILRRNPHLPVLMGGVVVFGVGDLVSFPGWV